MRIQSWAAGNVIFLLVLATPLHPQEEIPFEEEETASVDFNISAEVKANYRWSEDDRFPLAFPFPDDFVPAGASEVALATPSAGSSFEISRATVFLEAAMPRDMFGRVKIDIVDLYDRNPTSTDQNIDVDEAYLRFGRKYESLEPIDGSHAYVLFGKAPKFERQMDRRLESYGLVSTAFNRFEDIQLQIGGSASDLVYFRFQASTGNPTFFRDPNALAGDNGSVEPPEPDLTFESGFPIFYHAEVEEVSFDGEMEYGFGVGLRALTEDLDRGIDVLAFYYRTNLSESASLRGTFYEGDLDILDGVAGISLPISGNERTEWGFNVDANLGELGVFFQYVDEEAASLPRSGVELEIGYNVVTGDRGDPNALFTSFEPVLRYSKLDNDFTGPPQFVAPSVFWDWTKVDFGVRVGIRQGVDLFLEYAFHDIVARRDIAHDEFLATLSFRFP